MQVAWWRHQIETFSASLALCSWNSPATGEFPHKGQWRGALMFSLMGAWTNGWVSNREAGDLRCHHVHYYVTVMKMPYMTSPYSCFVIHFCTLCFQKSLWAPLPNALFVFFGISILVLVCFLPETLNSHLPESIEDVHRMRNSKSRRYSGP